MKLKAGNQKYPIWILILLLLIFTNNIFAQIGLPKALWQGIGNDTVNTKRVVKIDNGIVVKGGMQLDSLIVKNFIKVGDSAAVLVTDVSSAPFVDDLRSDLGRLSLGRGTALSNTGYSNVLVGIGAVKPQNQLHLDRQTNAAGTPLNFDVYSQYTNLFTGNATAFDGFRVGVLGTNGNAQVRQEEINNELQLITTSTGAKIVSLRATGGGNYNGQTLPDGMVAIGTCQTCVPGTNVYGTGPIFHNNVNPASRSLSLLVIGSVAGNIDDNRNVVAEFRSSSNAANVGIKIKGTRTAANDNLNEGFIDFSMWDNVTVTETQLARIGAGFLRTDNTKGVLRFYTRNDGSGSSTKMLIDNLGNTGIGNGIFSVWNGTTPTLPNARLDVADNTFNQLRLTRTYDFNPALGIHSDFRTTDFGDLVIRPFSSPQTIQERFVGIGLFTEGVGALRPKRKLDVYDNGVGTANGRPQLRLTQAQNLNPALGVYTDFQTTALGDLFINPVNGGNALALRPRFVGIQTNTPQNNVEIFSTAASPYTASNSSGLRFTHLTAASPILPNGTNGVDNTKILSVDQNGDVVLVQGGPGGGPLGNPCGVFPSNPLPISWEIPLDIYNYVFSGQSATNSNVGIGTTCVPAAKLDVLQSSTNNGSIGLNVINTDVQGLAGNFVANGPIGVRSLATLESPTTLSTTGVYGEAIYNSTKANFGVEGYSSESSSGNYGGRFQAKSTVNSPAFNYGLEAEGRFAATNYGGYFVARGNTSSTQSVGVWTTAFGGPVGSNAALWAEAPTAGDYAAILLGDVYFDGNLSGTNNVQLVSDSIFKTNIDTILNASNLITQLKPKTFYFDTTNSSGMRFSYKKQYGFIAQEVNTILPELVSTSTKPAIYDSTGALVHAALTYKSLNYNAFIAILMKGIQEQNKIVDSLKTKTNAQDSINSVLQNQIDQILNNMETCCNSNHSMQTNSSPNNSIGINVDLKDGQSIILDQNSPNPFAEQTTINYFLPDNVSKAQILFYNAQGKLIQSTELTQKGKGQLNVFAQDLSNGIYTYTLVVDGKIIETKKMVKQ